MNSHILFVALNLLLLLYLLWNCFRIYQQGYFVFLQPAVIASVLHFGLLYLIPNFRYITSTEWYNIAAYLPRDETFYWLNIAMFGILLAAVGMWNGYSSKSAIAISRILQEQLQRITVMRDNSEINLWVVLILIAMGVAAPIIQIRLGIFGYFSDGMGIKDSQSIAQWINVLSSAGKLALLTLSIAVFSKRYQHDQVMRVLFFSTLVFQVFAGLVGGFKSQVFIPFVIIGTGYYLVRHRLPKSIAVMSLCALIASFVLVEPLRRARYTTRDLDNRQVGSVVSTALSSFSNTFDVLLSEQPASDFSWYLLLSRLDSTTVTAIAIRFADSDQLDERNAPQFVYNLLLIPINAIIPRFLWEGKAVANDGWWFNVYVLGQAYDTSSSTGMGPISYLYFAGGYSLVFFGFWIIGAAQQVLFRTFAHGQIGNWIVFLGVLYPISVTDSNISASGASVIRLIPFLIIAQSLLVKRNR